MWKLKVIETMFFRIWLYRKRNWPLTFFQILVPQLILILFIYLHSTLYLKPEIKTNFTYYPKQNERDMYRNICIKPQCQRGPNGTAIISYYPNDFSTRKIIQQMRKILQPYSIEFKGVKKRDETDKLAILYNLAGRKDFIGGIDFIKYPNLIFGLKKLRAMSGNDEFALKVSIRMSKFIPKQLFSDHYHSFQQNTPENYQAFCGIQMAIWRAYLDIAKVKLEISKSDDAREFEINMQPFPYPPHKVYKKKGDNTLTHLDDRRSDVIIPTAIVLGLTLVVYSVVRAPVREKESGFQRFLRLMGLPRWAYWMTWLIDSCLVFTLVVIIQVILMFSDLSSNFGPLIKHGNHWIWLLVLLIYVFASISQLQFLATCFKRGILATYISATIWLLSYYFADLFVPSYIVQVSYAAKVCICLIPNGALKWALSLMTLRDGGIAWDNFIHPLEKDGLTLLVVVLMLILDTFLYFLLTLLVEYIMINGIKFPLLVLLYKCSRRRRNKFRDEVKKGDVEANPEKEYVIKMMNISKRFNTVKAIDQISLNVVKGETIVIMGFVGAGKSTILSVLSGDFFPSSGTAMIHNLDMRIHRKKISKYISISTGNITLCNGLSVIEHLLLIGKLKGLDHKKAMITAQRMLKSLEMSSKANKLPRHLFFYEKKKLSTALAFIGNSDVVLLDTPTKGLDIDQSQLIWDFITIYREGKTVLIASTEIEEAYFLGNQIILMSRGRFVNIGTREQIEKAYGTGYHLKLIMENEGGDVQREKAEAVIKKHVPGATFLEDKSRVMFDRGSFLRAEKTSQADIPMRSPSDTSINYLSKIVENLPELLPVIPEKRNSTEIVFSLPRSDTSTFPGLFTDLENEEIRAANMIKDFSLSFYSLENAHQQIDDYMKLLENEINFIKMEDEKITTTLLLEETFTRRISNPILLGLNRIRALLLKRFFWLCGHWYHLLIQLLMPLVLILITIAAIEHSYQPTSKGVTTTHSLKNIGILFSNSVPLIRDRSPSDLNFTDFGQVYKDSVVIPTKDIRNQTFMRFFKRKEESYIQSKYPIGVEIGAVNSVTAMYSRNGFHSAPLSLIVLLNTYLKYIVGSNEQDEFELSIETESDPIQYSSPKMADAFNFSDDNQIEAALTLSIMISYGFFILTAGFVVQPLTERFLKLKELQLFTNVGGFLYWISFLLWDLFFCAILCLLMIICLSHGPSHNAFYETEFQNHFASFFALASYSSIIHSYIFSFVFMRPSTSFFAMISVNQFGLFLFLIGMGIVNKSGLFYRLVFKILLPFCIPSGFYSLILLASENAKCHLIPEIVKSAICEYNSSFYENESERNRIDRSCCEDTCWKRGECRTIHPYIHWSRVTHQDEILTQDYIYLIIHCILATFVLILTELGYTKQIFNSPKKSQGSTFSEESHTTTDSVKSEAKTGEDSSQYPETKERNRDTLYIDRLSKEFSNRIALNETTFVAKPGEINAIVGPHNSGKTVFLELLGKLRGPTKGTAFYNGLELSEFQFASNVGFCTEDPNFFSRLTGLQMLNLFGRLRGIPESELNYHVSKWLRLLGLYERSRHYCEFYTYAMARKLTIALALIGDPPILLLDEPTKDLDPISKYKFWTIIQHLATQSNRNIILSSKRIGEVSEKGCRLGLIVNGNLQSIMYANEIMNKFGQGFTLEIGLDDQSDLEFRNYSRLKNQIENSFAGKAILVQEKSNALIYRIKNPDLKWSVIFTTLEEIKVKFENIIAEYKVQGTTLDDIYQRFANRQREYTRNKTALELFCFTYC